MQFLNAAVLASATEYKCAFQATEKKTDCFFPDCNDYAHLGGARPVRSRGGIGRVSVSTGREVAIVNIPLQNKIMLRKCW